MAEPDLDANPPPERNLLKHAILALAQPGEVQLSLFLDFVCRADELALNFEDGLYELVGHCDEVSESQLAAVRALETRLAEMSGGHNAELWTDDAVLSDPIWEDIRSLAKAAAAASSTTG